jgi:hypothetical protein
LGDRVEIVVDSFVEAQPGFAPVITVLFRFSASGRSRSRTKSQRTSRQHHSIGGELHGLHATETAHEEIREPSAPPKIRAMIYPARSAPRNLLRGGDCARRQKGLRDILQVVFAKRRLDYVCPGHSFRRANRRKSVAYFLLLFAYTDACASPVCGRTERRLLMDAVVKLDHAVWVFRAGDQF